MTDRPQVVLVVMFFMNALVLNACQQVKQATPMVGTLIVLSKDIAAKFGETYVSCDYFFNGSSLTINLLNSRRGNLPEEARRAAALDIARYAYAHFESRDQLSQVRVCFVRQRKLILFTYKDATDIFSFRGGDLATWYGQQASEHSDQLGDERREL